MSWTARFRRLPHNRAKGAEAERRAVSWLRRAGYRIVATNVVTAGGELDVVAREGDTLCFVEVKSRTGGRFGPAVLAVNAEKRRRLIRAARSYLARRPWDGPCRFDVLGIDLLASGSPDYTLLRDAFRAED